MLPAGQHAFLVKCIRVPNSVFFVNSIETYVATTAP